MFSRLPETLDVSVNSLTTASIRRERSLFSCATPPLQLTPTRCDTHRSASEAGGGTGGGYRESPRSCADGNSPRSSVRSRSATGGPHYQSHHGRHSWRTAGSAAASTLFGAGTVHAAGAPDPSEDIRQDAGPSDEPEFLGLRLEPMDPADCYAPPSPYRFDYGVDAEAEAEAEDDAGDRLEDDERVDDEDPQYAGYYLSDAARLRLQREDMYRAQGLYSIVELSPTPTEERTRHPTNAKRPGVKGCEPHDVGTAENLSHYPWVSEGAAAAVEENVPQLETPQEKPELKRGGRSNRQQAEKVEEKPTTSASSAAKPAPAVPKPAAKEEEAEPSEHVSFFRRLFGFGSRAASKTEPKTVEKPRKSIMSAEESSSVAYINGSQSSEPSSAPQQEADLVNAPKENENSDAKSRTRKEVEHPAIIAAPRERDPRDDGGDGLCDEYDMEGLYADEEHMYGVQDYDENDLEQIEAEADEPVPFYYDKATTYSDEYTETVVPMAEA